MAVLIIYQCVTQHSSKFIDFFSESAATTYFLILGSSHSFTIFFFQAEDAIRERDVTGVQTCALPVSKVPLSLVEMQ